MPSRATPRQRQRPAFKSLRCFLGKAIWQNLEEGLLSEAEMTFLGSPMALLPILRYPDPGLKTVCAPVTVFDDALSTLADDLLETMRKAAGVGITAAHAGIFFRVVVLELKPGEPRLYINPEILSSSTERIQSTEGSVSMPGVTEELDRPRAIRIRFQDLKGEHHEAVMSGFEAVCMQHEIDQLDGIFWINRLSRLKRERVIKRFQKANR